MFQEESAILQENILYVKLYQYNQKYLYLKLKGYGDTDMVVLQFHILLPV
jgi:hypothetical protein